MYGFGNIPSTFSSKPRYVTNDIRQMHSRLNNNRFGYNHFGAEDSDDSDSDYNHFGAAGTDSDSDDSDNSDYNHFGAATDDSDDSNLDFGKKSRNSAAVRRNRANAKKAMKMAYDKGISLKQAWKIVKGTSSGRKTTKKTTKRTKKTKKTTAKKSTKGQASKAMKLAHREGISLKKAWSIVKKGR